MRVVFLKPHPKVLNSSVCACTSVCGTHTRVKFSCCQPELCQAHCTDDLCFVLTTELFNTWLLWGSRFTADANTKITIPHIQCVRNVRFPNMQGFFFFKWNWCLQYLNFTRTPDHIIWFPFQLEKLCVCSCIHCVVFWLLRVSPPPPPCLSLLSSFCLENLSAAHYYWSSLLYLYTNRQPDEKHPTNSSQWSRKGCTALTALCCMLVSLFTPFLSYCNAGQWSMTPCCQSALLKCEPLIHEMINKTPLHLT